MTQYVLGSARGARTKYDEKPGDLTPKLIWYGQGDRR